MSSSNAQAPAPIDPAVYERLISEGIADADKRGGSVDHVTARRLALWLYARHQQPALADALVRFTRTGLIHRDMVTGLRDRSRAVNSPHRGAVARLLQYVASRPDHGAIGADFGPNCDKIDQADAILIDAKERAGNTTRPARPSPETGRLTVTAQAGRDPGNPVIHLRMDAATAGLVMFAIAANASDREAYARETERFSNGLPEGSYGKANRQAIANRETQAANRLRAIERAYQIALGQATTAIPATAPHLATQTKPSTATWKWNNAMPTPETTSAAGTTADPPAARAQAAGPLRLDGDTLITITDIRRIFRLGRTAAYELTRRPGFPDPVQVSARCYRWWASEVDAYATALPREHARQAPRQASGSRPPDPATPPRQITGRIRAARTSKKNPS
jgi:predicted DNA-binding transcriptional regulator AlpA